MYSSLVYLYFILGFVESSWQIEQICLINWFKNNWQLIFVFMLCCSGNGDGFYSSAFQSQLEGNSLHNASMPRGKVNHINIAFLIWIIMNEYSNIFMSRDTASI